MGGHSDGATEFLVLPIARLLDANTPEAFEEILRPLLISVGLNNGGLEVRANHHLQMLQFEQIPRKY